MWDWLRRLVATESTPNPADAKREVEAMQRLWAVDRTINDLELKLWRHDQERKEPY